MESLTASKDEAIIWRGPIKFSAIKQFIGEVAWGDLDYLLIDAPPGTGDELLTVAQVIKDTKAIVVTQPHEVSLNDVRKSLSFCKRMSMPVLGIVENMSGFICPHCNQSTDIFGSGGGAKTAMEYNLVFLGKIPFDNRMVECGDKGESYQDKYPDSEVTKSYAQIAEKVAEFTK